jgi:protein AATF/BFR2
MQLVDETLQGANHIKLLARTKVKRSKRVRVGELVGEEDGEDPDMEIFDDTNFYQQLLRDIIDAQERRGEVEDWTIVHKQKEGEED